MTQKNNKNITGILLAAGNSSRFPGNKLLQKFKNNKPLIMCSLENMQGIYDTIIAVVNPQHQQIQNLLLQSAVTVCINEQAQQGMGTSISCGVRHSAQAQAWVIVLADMPLIVADYHQGIKQALLNNTPIAAYCYQGKKGHPVGFSRQYYTDLVNLDADQGAREVLRKNKGNIHWLQANSDAVLKDIDNEANLVELRGLIG